MSITRCSARVATATADCPAIFAPPGGADFFATQDWFDTVIGSGMVEGRRARFVVAPGGALVLPLQTTGLPGHLEGLTNPYTCAFAPLCTPGLAASAVSGLGAAVASELRRWATIRLDALSAADEVTAAFVRGARRGGLLPVWFDHFGNWREDVRGRDWPSYLAARDGPLRTTIRRKLARAERASSVSWTLFRGEAEVEAGISAYESVYARSWKDPEPFPRFNPAIMRVAARHGVLRLTVLRERGSPIAAQFWIVASGRATVLKLAHDEAAKASSPGTVLTAMTIRHFMTEEAIGELDFGRGDDPYKRLWARTRRQRVGVVLVNPWRPEGAAFLLRHGAGRLRRAASHIIAAAPPPAFARWVRRAMMPPTSPTTS